MGYKAKYSIILHKSMTIFVVLSLMFYYQNFGLGPQLYLAIHGSYCLLWLMKQHYFPDKGLDCEMTIFKHVCIFLLVAVYWIAPYLLISGGQHPSSIQAAVAVICCMFGTFFQFCGDCQKYFILKYKKGLVDEALFSQSRNINYFGEVILYLSFNIIAQHWLPFVCQGLFIAFVFYPNMLKKDQSLSRYEGFKQYKERTWLLLPKVF